MARLRTRPAGIRSEVIDIQDIQETPEPADRTTADQEEPISKRAYELWLERGCPEGSPEEDWYRAESEIRDRKHEVISGVGGGA